MQSNILKLMMLTSFDFLDGQKIAKKLSVQISKETKKIKVLIPDYNTCRTIQGEAMISLQEALDPVALSQTMYSTTFPSCTSSSYDMEASKHCCFEAYWKRMGIR